MRSTVRLWRWRRNSLRRRSDVIEAWAGLFAVLLVVLGAPAAAWTAGRSVGGALEHTMRVQHAERSLVPARVLRMPSAVGGSGPESAVMHDNRRPTTVRWTAPDGNARTGTVRIDADRRTGDEVRIWTDRNGRLVGPPLEAATADTHAVLAGLGAAAGVGLLAVVTRQLAVRRLMRQRLAGWERDWARVAPGWGRADTGGQSGS